MKTKSRARNRSAVLLAGILLAGVVAAQPPGEPSAQSRPKTAYALIFGTVYKASGAPAYGVPIKIRLASDRPGKSRWDLVSDRHGEFAQRVPPGKAEYFVWADIKVPKKAIKPNVSVHIENEERQDISLHLTQ